LLIGLSAQTDPLNWLRAVYTRQKKVEQAKKSMKRIDGHVAGYDVEREFLVLATEIEHAEFIREEMQGHKIVEIFRGVNLVSRNSLRAESLYHALTRTASNPCFHLPHCSAAALWRAYFLLLSHM
jgi:hypothetical protein